MGLFDQIASAAGALSSRQEGGAGPVDAIMRMIDDPQTGGFSGLAALFRKGGLGSLFDSWVSTGQNLPITPQQLAGVLGNERIRSFADRLGINPQQASEQLAQFLPQVVDKLTPDGNLPSSGNLLSQGLAMLKGKFFS